MLDEQAQATTASPYDGDASPYDGEGGAAGDGAVNETVETNQIFTVRPMSRTDDHQNC